MRKKWKKNADIIVPIILTMAYTIATLLNIIGPLHMDKTGAMIQPGILVLYSLLYWFFSIVLTWALYLELMKKPKVQFFTLVILGIVLIVAENFLWAWVGSVN